MELTTEGITIGSVYVPAGCAAGERSDVGKRAFLEAVARHACDELLPPAADRGRLQRRAHRRGRLRAGVVRRLLPDRGRRAGGPARDPLRGRTRRRLPHAAPRRARLHLLGAARRPLRARLRAAHRPDPRVREPRAVHRRLRCQPHLPQGLSPLQPRAPRRGAPGRACLRTLPRRAGEPSAAGELLAA